MITVRFRDIVQLALEMNTLFSQQCLTGCHTCTGSRMHSTDVSSIDQRLHHDNLHNLSEKVVKAVQDGRIQILGLQKASSGRQ